MDNPQPEVQPEAEAPRKQEEPRPALAPDVAIDKKAKRRGNFDQTARRVRSWVLNIAIIFFVLILGKVLFQEVYDRGYHLQSLRVPQEFEINGYDGATAAYLILDDVNKMIAIGNRNRNTRDVEEFRESAERNQLQVEVAGIGISPEAIASYLRQAIGIRPKTIGAEIVRQDNKLKMSLRISGWPTEIIIQKIDSSGAAKAFEDLLQLGAESILRKNYPLILGNYYWDQRNEKALDALEQAIQSHRDQAADAYATMAGFIAFQHRDSTQALRLIRKALAIEPKNSTVYGMWGVILDRYNGAECERLLRKAVELDPTNINSWSNLGRKLYFAGKNDEEAIGCFERCRLLDSTYTYALENWVSVLFAQGKFDQAGEKFERLQFLDASFSPEMAVAIPAITGDKERALQKYLSLTLPNQRYVLNRLNSLADEQGSRGRINNGIKLIRFELSLDSTSSESPFAYSTLAELHSLAGDKEKFYTFIDKAFHRGFRLTREEFANMKPYKSVLGEDRFDRLLAKYGMK